MDKATITLPYLFASNDSYAIEYMVLQRLAIGQILNFTAHKWINKQRLVEILPEFKKPDFEVFMIYASHHYPSAIVRAFVEFVLENA